MKITSLIILNCITHRLITSFIFAHHSKCEDFILATKTIDFSHYDVELKCVRGKTKFDCWEKISRLEVDLMTLEAGDLYYAGRHYSIIPLMREQSKACRKEEMRERWMKK